MSKFMFGALCGAVLTLALSITLDARADDHVKYCRNANTGEIITVPANMPCPFPTHEL